MHTVTGYAWAVGGIFLGAWAYAYASQNGIV